MISFLQGVIMHQKKIRIFFFLKKAAHNPHLISARLVCGHMSLKLGAVSESVVAQGAGKVLLVLLMAVLDVLLE